MSNGRIHHLLMALTVLVVLMGALVVLEYVESSHLAERGYARIFNGAEAQGGEFPYMVTYFGKKFKRDHYCAGVILDDHTILTAASCISDVNRGRHPMPLNNLTGPGAIRPIKLPEYGYADYEGNLTTVGWGMTCSGEYSDTLLKMTSKAYSTSECKAKSPWKHIDDTKICAGGTSSQVVADDLGGPLIWKNKNGEEEVVGIVSYGLTLGCSNEPLGIQAAYTRVSMFIPWIAEQRNLTTIVTPKPAQ